MRRRRSAVGNYAFEHEDWLRVSKAFSALGSTMVSVCRLCILVDKFVYLERDAQASFRGKRNGVLISDVKVGR